jgi:hypothetical protein
MSCHSRANVAAVAIVVAVLASACAATAPTPRSSTATRGAPTIGPGATAPIAGTHALKVEGAGSYP